MLRDALPLVDGLLIFLIGLDKPLADAHKAAVHEAAFQQVVDGFEEQCATLVRQTTFPHTVFIT